MGLLFGYFGVSMVGLILCWRERETLTLHFDGANEATMELRTGALNLKLGTLRSGSS